MNKLYSYFWLLLLVTYSVVLISIEITTSQDFVRNFFADIKGEVPFYAINTSLSVILLFATSLMFKINLVILKTLNQADSQKTFFYYSQAIFFLYLAFDDRFLIHEEIGYLVGINDAYFLLFLGVLEIVLIAVWGNYQKWSKSSISYIYKAAICFGIMVLVDGALPRDMILRLSLEDLAKTWANVFLFLFSWDIFKENIATLKQYTSCRSQGKGEREKGKGMI